MRNPLFSKKFKRTEVRLLIIDDNQIRYNQICEQLQKNKYSVISTLLDDIKNFEKQLNFSWDMIIFGRAYDLQVDQAAALIQASKQPNLPLLLLKPDNYDSSQYTQYIKKGIYDIINLECPEASYYTMVRTISFSRLQQAQEQLMKELNNAHHQAQSLAQGSTKALAILQEGIHIQANTEYLEFFGFNDESDIIGLPLLDLLQPQNLTEFKSQFKKAAHGQFNLGTFEVKTNNPTLSKHNPLHIEFLSATEDDAIQISIDLEDHHNHTMSDISLESPQNKNIYHQINHTLMQQPAAHNAAVIFSLINYPNKIFQSEWPIMKLYLAQIFDFLKEQTHVPLFKIETGIYLGLFQAESTAILESKLIALNALLKPQLLTIQDKTYPLQFHLGYTQLEGQIQEEQQFERLITQAFKTPLPHSDTNLANNTNQILHQDQTTPLLQDLEFSLEPTSTVVANTQTEKPIETTPKVENLYIEPIPPKENALIETLQNALTQGEIHLKYQQLFDKQDECLHTYEVTSGFIFNNEWHNCSDLKDLSENAELSIQLDRWILVEACKQLHNFIIQYPEAKLIVNLNKHILLHDKSLPDLVTKLITIIGSSVENPLILQFNEEDIHINLADAQKQIQLLIASGAEISLRKFGTAAYSSSLLKHITIQYVCLDEQFATKLEHEESQEELTHQLTSFQEIQDFEIILRDLNNMNLFANAWNVNARFIQGDYFQKKLDHLIDVQEQ